MEVLATPRRINNLEGIHCVRDARDCPLQTAVSRGRDLFGEPMIVEAGLAEAQFTERAIVENCFWCRADVRQPHNPKVTGSNPVPCCRISCPTTSSQFNGIQPSSVMRKA